MKIAFYMEDGVEQIVLTPQTKSEQTMLENLHQGGREIAVCRGKFYETRGGWITQGSISHHDFNRGTNESTMLVLRPERPSKMEREQQLTEIVREVAQMSCDTDQHADLARRSRQLVAPLEV